MKGLIGCLLTLLIAIVFFALVPLIRIGHFLFQVKRGKRQSGFFRDQSKDRPKQSQTAPEQKPKIYAADEGEYVDFEEINDSEGTDK